jgi:methionyl aminopeptidase
MIVCKSAAELETMHRAGLVVWDVLNRLRQAVQPGVSTLDLEKIAAQGAQEHGARPAFKGYRGYPCVLCASINQEVVHGIPSGARRLKEGDVISLDFGVELDGYYGDAAVTLPVGKIRPEVCDLLRVTRESLDKAIEKVQPGNRLSDISASVHEEPNLPNYGEPGHGPRLEEGMVFAIEPMVNAGGPGVKVLEDKWTAVTLDGSCSAHFEHTVAVTSNGPWILTRPREAVGASW